MGSSNDRTPWSIQMMSSQLECDQAGCIFDPETGENSDTKLKAAAILAAQMEIRLVI